MIILEKSIFILYLGLIMLNKFHSFIQKTRIQSTRILKYSYILSSTNNNILNLDHKLSCDVCIIGGGHAGITTIYNDYQCLYNS